MSDVIAEEMERMDKLSLKFLNMCIEKSSKAEYMQQMQILSQSDLIFVKGVLFGSYTTMPLTAPGSPALKTAIECAIMVLKMSG